MTKTYLTNLFKTHQKGDAREESYYKHLADFIAAFSESQRKKKIERFPQSGTNTIEKTRFVPTEETEHAPSLPMGRVYINAEQYFAGATAAVWCYQICGYQICDKWLTNPKVRTFALGDIQTYCRIITVPAKTIELQKEIDDFYESVEETVLTPHNPFAKA